MVSSPVALERTWTRKSIHASLSLLSSSGGGGGGAVAVVVAFVAFVALGNTIVSDKKSKVSMVPSVFNCLAHLMASFCQY